MAKRDAITKKTAPRFANTASKFAEGVNEFFIEEGIGWQFVCGQIVTRGTEAFEAVVTEATSALEASKRPTAAKHLREALEDLSRRPQADLPAAIYHAMGALECVARDLTGDTKATLGEAIKRNPGLLAKPLDTALSQIWGYASNEARHVQEGRETSREEAELLVGAVRRAVHLSHPEAIMTPAMIAVKRNPRAGWPGRKPSHCFSS